ncbi:HPr kinase/phosphorylase [Ruegeria halocynthiae]|uniref:HPr kinase/phosphorylase n=1 Tax=Ruegeria halocynthiae TaxID=985054 RepID=UPI00068AC43E|nr:HPr kinase/phosphatase C-terminal domain-containing protein [Ruegeria halocynthiae]
MCGGTLLDTHNLETAIIHATCVAVAGQGALIVGRSGAGKSALALQMMGNGAALVADDRVVLRMVDGRAVADAAPNLGGLIEARGIGILRAQAAGPTLVSLVVDLDQEDPSRLPEPSHAQVLRQTVPLLLAAGTPNLPAALMQLLKMGRVNPQWPNT